MSLLSRKNLFFVLLSIGLLLLFLLAETYLSWYVIGGLTLLLLLFYHDFPLKKQINAPVFWMIVTILGVFGLTLLSSVSLPLSIEAFAQYCFLFASFLFFWTRKFTVQDKTTLFWLLVFQGITLVFLSSLFLLFPEYGSKIPGMNVIFSTYGHNHLGAILLLLLPVSFWLYLSEQKKWQLLILATFVIALIMSFGRVVILLGFTELLFMVIWYLRKRKFNFKSRSFKFLSVLLVLFVLGISWYVYSGWKGESCAVGDNIYQTQLCKTGFSQNVRFYYWQQAWQALQDRPWMGFGIGTFGPISYLYRQIPNFYSAYAHNDYLQFFAEGGLIAGLAFVILLFLTYQETWRHVKNSSDVLLFFGLASFGIDMFFDFDFHFLGIAFLFFLIFGVLGFSDKDKHHLIPIEQAKRLVIGLLLGTALFSGLYIVTDSLISFGKDKQAFNIYPFFHWQSLSFMKSSQLTVDQKKFLGSVYLTSPKVQDLLIGSLEGEEKAVAERRAWLADPWRKTNSFVPQYYLEEKNDKALKEVLQEIMSFLDFKLTKYNFKRDNIPFKYKNEWGQQLIYLAHQSFAEQKYDEAGKYLQQAYYLNEWSIGKMADVFTELSVVKPEKLSELLKSLLNIPPNFFGVNREQLAGLYFEQILLELQSGQDNNWLVQATERNLDLADWRAGRFKTEVFQNGLVWQELISQGNWQDLYRYGLVLNVLQTHRFTTRSSYSELDQIKFSKEWFHAVQQFIDQRLENEDEVTPVLLLDKLATTQFASGDFYWLLAQRGYFYGLLGQNDLAKQAFEECLADNPDHEDCQHGLDNLIDKEYPDVNRYYEIREIILNL